MLSRLFYLRISESHHFIGFSEISIEFEVGKEMGLLIWNAFVRTSLLSTRLTNDVMNEITINNGTAIASRIGNQISGEYAIDC